MEVRGPRDWRLPDARRADGVIGRWRGLMGRQPHPLLLRTSSVHGFFLRQPLRIVALDRDLTVVAVGLLSRRRLAWVPGARWILELPLDHPPPRVGDRLEFGR